MLAKFYKSKLNLEFTYTYNSPLDSYNSQSRDIFRPILVLASQTQFDLTHLIQYQFEVSILIKEVFGQFQS